VLVGCLDEIFFHGRPVLVGVGPASMTWFLGHKADDRTGATWAGALRDWDGLSFVTADAGKGLQAGIAAVRRERQEDALESGLDVFHTTYEARRVLRLIWNRVERLWEQAEAASRRAQESASSATASGKPAKDRITPGIAGDSRANRLSSPKSAASTVAAALPMVEWPDEYSGKAGVTSNGDQSGSVRRMAVTGRQKVYVYFVSQQAITASAIARFSIASARAFSDRSVPRSAARSRATRFQA
jgi:hypothetical protein